MNREIKFRVWDKITNQMCEVWGISFKAWDSYPSTINFITIYVGENGIDDRFEHQVDLMQWTGFKYKNGFNDIFEFDIINSDGFIIGNFYENQNLLEEKTNFLIKEMGTKAWNHTESEIIKRECFYSN